MSTQNEKGFSTLEITIAFAILALVLGGVVLANFGAQYWTITSQTSNEALYKARIRLEDLRADAKRNFLSATSSALARDDDAACLSGSLCYYIESAVTDISQCSKYASSTVSWQVSGYPTTTASLFTTFADANGVIKLGGDCALNWPSGTWAQPQLAKSTSLTSDPAAIDAVGGTVYIAEGGAPYLEVVSGGTAYPYASQDGVVFNAIDAARSLDPNRPFTYVYAAASSTINQLQVIDVTDPTSIFQASALTLKPSGSYPQGWRIAFYDRTIYIVTRETSGPELHVVDVSIPTSPAELGNGIELGFTATDIAVRDQMYQGVLRRLAYLASVNASEELSVWDVTNPTNAVLIKACTASDLGISGSQSASKLALLGNRAYLGLDVPRGNDDLFMFNADDPSAATFCTPIAHTSVDHDGKSLHPSSFRVSGPYLFVAINNTQDSAGEIQIRSTDPADPLALLGTYSGNLTGLVENGIDFDSDTNLLYAASAGPASLQTLSPSP